jgi:hypothetical protein
MDVLSLLFNRFFGEKPDTPLLWAKFFLLVSIGMQACLFNYPNDVSLFGLVPAIIVTSLFAGLYFIIGTFNGELKRDPRDAKLIIYYATIIASVGYTLYWWRRRPASGWIDFFFQDPLMYLVYAGVYISLVMILYALLAQLKRYVKGRIN